MAAPPGRATTVKMIGALSNKGMKLTKPEHIGALQLIWHAPCQSRERVFVR